MERSTCRSKGHAPPLRQQAQPEFYQHFPVQDWTPVQACREAHFGGPPYSLTCSLPNHLWIAGKCFNTAKLRRKDLDPSAAETYMQPRCRQYQLLKCAYLRTSQSSDDHGLDCYKGAGAIIAIACLENYSEGDKSNLLSRTLKMSLINSGMPKASITGLYHKALPYNHPLSSVAVSVHDCASFHANNLPSRA